MTRDEAIRRLRAHEAALRSLGVTRLALFGSLARGEAGLASDVDVVVDVPADVKFSLLDLASMRVMLRDILGRETDVVVRDDLRPRLRDAVARDSVSVF